jgi:ABC-type transport system involved in cytochrome bd biosynthesis fused ATPase/permease subunit
MVSALESVGLGELVERSETGLGLNLARTASALRRTAPAPRVGAVLLADRPVLLMDEPTSAVDSRTEQLLQRTLSEGRASRTVVVVAHRLSTIADFDRILVMDRGRVVASGTHATLVHSSALYRDMAVRQRLVQHA